MRIKSTIIVTMLMAMLMMLSLLSCISYIDNESEIVYPFSKGRKLPLPSFHQLVEQVHQRLNELDDDSRKKYLFAGELFAAAFLFPAHCFRLLSVVSLG